MKNKLNTDKNSMTKTLFILPFIHSMIAKSILLRLKPLFIFLLSLFSIPTFAQADTYIEGTITSENKPIIGANISVGGLAESTTDENGYYKFEVQEGRYTVTFSHLDCQSAEREIFFNAMETVTLDIELQKVKLSPLMTIITSKTEDYGILKGKVTADGEILIAASVYISGEVNGKVIGTTTDFEGNYTLKIPEGKHKLCVNYIGYTSKCQDVLIKANETVVLNIELLEQVTLLNTATVTSGKYEKPLGEVTVSLEILRLELIASSNAPTIDVGLEKVPGVNIIDGQPNIRSGSGYSYGAGSRVLLLINDVPALQADAGFPNWNDISLENIEQIEIVKGAASALYGSSAMNGIINIRTAYATEEPVTKVATFGTQYLAPKDLRKKWWGDTLRYDAGVSLAHRQKFGKLDVVLGASYLKENGPSKAVFVEYFRFNTSLRYRITDRLSVGVHGTLTTGQSGNMFFWANDSTGAYLPSNGSAFSSDITRFTIDPFVTYFDKNDNRHKFLGRWYSVNNDNSNGNAIYSDLLYGEYQFQREFDNNLVLTAGLVGMHSASEGPLYGDTAYTTSNIAIYIQADRKLFDKLNLSFGGRYEINTISNPTLITTFGDTILTASASEAKPVFRFGANYQAADFTYIRVSFGQGYRFPTVAEKFISTQIGAGNFSIPIFQNPDLTSETGWSAEIGVKQGFKISNWNGFFDAAAFLMEYNNMMEFSFVAAQVVGFQSRNVGNTRISGFEVSVAGQGEIGEFKTGVLAGYTYTNPIFKEFTTSDSISSSADYNVLKYRFRHTAKADVETTYKGFSVGLAMLYTSYMEAIDNVFNLVIPGVRTYREANQTGALVTNIRASYQINDRFRVGVIANNIFNTEYMLRPGLLEAPRNIGVRIDAKF
jgi:iron complex outermembrane receptor protein